MRSAIVKVVVSSLFFIYFNASYAGLAFHKVENDDDVRNLASLYRQLNPNIDATALVKNATVFRGYGGVLYAVVLEGGGQ